MYWFNRDSFTDYLFSFPKNKRVPTLRIIIMFPQHSTRHTEQINKDLVYLENGFNSVADHRLKKTIPSPARLLFLYPIEYIHEKKNAWVYIGN